MNENKIEGQNEIQTEAALAVEADETLLGGVNGNSKYDEEVNKLTGFVPADRSKRKCISCGQNGHYYYECNDGEFLKMTKGFVTGLSAISNKD